MNKLLALKLKALKDFQEKYPTSHVGGSVGLFLRGMDLNRDLSESDLDITVDEFEPNSRLYGTCNEGSNPRDFNYRLTQTIGDNFWVKIDVRISPEPSFDIVNFDGVDYNVSKFRDIIFWKTKYAHKGIDKHINDLKNLGINI